MKAAIVTSSATNIAALMFFLLPAVVVLADDDSGSSSSSSQNNITCSPAQIQGALYINAAGVNIADPIDDQDTFAFWGTHNQSGIETDGKHSRNPHGLHFGDCPYMMPRSLTDKNNASQVQTPAGFYVDIGASDAGYGAASQANQARISEMHTDQIIGLTVGGVGGLGGTPVGAVVGASVGVAINVFAHPGFYQDTLKAPTHFAKPCAPGYYQNNPNTYTCSNTCDLSEFECQDHGVLKHILNFFGIAKENDNSTRWCGKPMDNTVPAFGCAPCDVYGPFAMSVPDNRNMLMRGPDFNLTKHNNRDQIPSSTNFAFDQFKAWNWSHPGFFPYQNNASNAGPLNVMAHDPFAWELFYPTDGTSGRYSLSAVRRLAEQNLTRLFYSQFGASGCTNLAAVPMDEDHVSSESFLVTPPSVGDSAHPPAPLYFTAEPAPLNSWYPERCANDTNTIFYLFSPRDGVYYDGATPGTLTAEQMVELRKSNSSFWLPDAQCRPLPVANNASGATVIKVGTVEWGADTGLFTDWAGYNRAIADDFGTNSSSSSIMGYTNVSNREYPSYGPGDYSFIQPGTTVCARVTCQLCPPGRARGGGGTTVGRPATSNYARSRLGAAFLDAPLRLTGPDLDAVCPKCCPGTFSSTPNATTPSVCLPCPPGEWTPFNGSTTCLKCPLGFYCNQESSTPCSGGQGAIEPRPCPLGSFANQTGMARCHNCDPGYGTPGEATIRGSECSPGAVPPGYSFADWVNSTAMALKASLYKVMYLDGYGVVPFNPMVYTEENVNKSVVVPWLRKCALGHFSAYPRLFKNGTASNSSNNTSHHHYHTCPQCSQGRFASREGSVMCSPCGEPGTPLYQDEVGASSCKVCRVPEAVLADPYKGLTSAAAAKCRARGVNPCTKAATLGTTQNLTAGAPDPCEWCPLGYVVQLARSRCSACPAGKVSDVACAFNQSSGGGNNKNTATTICAGSDCEPCPFCRAPPGSTGPGGVRAKHQLLPNLDGVSNASWLCEVPPSSSSQKKSVCADDDDRGASEMPQNLKQWQEEAIAAQGAQEHRTKVSSVNVIVVSSVGVILLAVAVSLVTIAATAVIWR